MLSAQSIFDEFRADDRAFCFFMSLAAKGEDQGGFENERIAALTPDRELAAKIARHGEDEGKHARLFNALLRKRGLEPMPVPLEADYCMKLEKAGVGLSHERLERDEMLSMDEVLAYLVHSRVTEQRGAEEIFQQKKLFGDDDEVGKAIHMIADDEENHLAYCHEELLRLRAEGHGPAIDRLLRQYAIAECDIYHDMSLAVLRQMADILGWPSWKRALLSAGVHGVWAIERLGRWRRMLRLEEPERKNAMAPRGAEPAGASA